MREYGKWRYAPGGRDSSWLFLTMDGIGEIIVWEGQPRDFFWLVTGRPFKALGRGVAPTLREAMEQVEGILGTFFSGLASEQGLDAEGLDISETARLLALVHDLDRKVGGK